MTPEEKKTKRQLSLGTCFLCENLFGKAAMTKHLAKCRNVKSTNEGKKVESFQLLVEGGYKNIYWMYLAVPTTASLKQVDSFLRTTWLECCGHLSAFTIEGQRYSVSPSSELDERDMKMPLARVLQVGCRFLHEYDYGSTTELGLRVIDVIEIAPRLSPTRPVHLLARNEPPEFRCVECDDIAIEVCVNCSLSEDSWLCESCIESHECGEEMLLPIVNSPRVGVCAYTG